MHDDNASTLLRMYSGQKRLQSILFTGLAVPVALYCLAPSPLILWAGAAYLGVCSLLLRAKSRSLRKVYGGASETTVEWLRGALGAAGCSPDPGRLAYGYMNADGETRPVLLAANGDMLHIFENPLRKSCIYAVENDFCYLFEPAENREVRQEAVVSAASCLFRDGKGSHTDFLLERQRLTGTLGAVEIFVYEHLLAGLHNARPEPMLNCAHALVAMRKEKLMTAELPEGRVLHIPGPAFSRLALAV